MPNWCFNAVKVSHEDPNMIQRMIDAADKTDSGILQEFVPCPAELRETLAGSFGDADKQAELKAKQEENFLKFGAKDWYDWCINNWGTKWDLREVRVDCHDANNITLSFDTAWSPPIEAYGTLEELGFIIEAYYYEPGMCFCGLYEDGCENTINIRETTYEWASKNIPRAIDEMFGISDEYAQWEAEKQE